MTLAQITALFKWMTIINVSLLVLSSVLVMLLKNIVCSIHAKLFGLTEAKAAMAVYCYLGMFKIMVIIFNIVPYIALLLIQ